MLNKKFKIYFYFCVFIFFFLSGIVLFYSFGYKYSIEKNKTVQIGAIVIKTYPKKVDIYKNNLLYKNNKTIANLFTDSIIINNLEVAKYNIKIKKDKYFQWEKNIDVKSGYVTELKNIVLLKNNYNRNIIVNKMGMNSDKNNIWINNGKNEIAYGKEVEGKLDLAIFNINENKENIIADFRKFPFNQIQKKYNFDKVIFSNDDTKIILKIGTKNKTFWYLIEIGNENKIYNLTSIFMGNKEIRNKWNLSFNKSLFYTKDNVLYEFDYTKMFSKKLLKNVNSFLVQDNSIYFFSLNDDKLYSSDLNNLSNIKKIAIMSKNFNSKSLTKIIKTNQNTYFILSSSGELYFINNKNKINFINSSVKKVKLFYNDERIIYNKNHEIWIYYTKNKISQPIKKESTNELITRFSGNISDIFLYKDNEHIFYKEGNSFKFSELDDRDRKNVFDIMKIYNNNIFYSNTSNSLYYIKNNRLIQIDLNEK